MRVVFEINVLFLYVVVDLRDVKEVRPGKHSKDFERWPEEAKKADVSTCFIILYGQDFRLKTLSVAGETIYRLAIKFHNFHWLLSFFG